MNSKFKPIIIVALIAIVVFGAVYGGISITKNLGKSDKQITSEKAEKELNKIYDKITVNNIPAKKEPVNFSSTSLQDSLPDINKYPPQVQNTTENFIEIFSSTEKAGTNTDGWLNEVARDFNNSNVQVNGKKVSVRIRGIASGMGMDYIVSGKYVPDAFTPSNELWGEMMKSEGVQINLKEKRLVGNVAGILISNKKNDEFVKKYGAINLKNITEAVGNNKFAMGYTNPFASSTGLNFLVSTLSTFDGKDPLGEKAVQSFEKFQANIPFVAYTTLQMTEAAKTGILDGFIMEYQTYANLPDVKANYVFNPFGVRHDSPIYEIGNLSTEKKEILNKFIEFSKVEKYQTLASKYGFNQLDDYKSEIEIPSGDVIAKAQKLWKEKKDSNKSISAVFVADVSGSMQGEPLNKLKKSLLTGAQYIDKNNSIGLVTYSDDVNINLPIGKFDINQMSAFTGAVNSMQANGSTATFDAIIVAAKMLMDEKQKNPDGKQMIFVLSDGETNKGHSLDDISGILKTLKIPVYTIGYNANLKALESISNINEAASINADSDDVIYKLKELFNAQM